MSNKKVIKKVFEQQFSAEQNYQVISKSIEKRRSYGLKLFWQCALVPTFTIMLLLITGAFRSDNNNEFHATEESLMLPTRMSDYEKYVSEVNIRQYHTFIDDIFIPAALNKQQGVILYRIEGTVRERHDYVLTFTGLIPDRKVIISFTEAGVESLRGYHIALPTARPSLMVNGVTIEHSNLLDKYSAIFEIHGLVFTIEGYGVTLQEFTKILESILN